jgi:peptidyl-tRNA hydrolase, PTH1 family
MKLIVGLGNPGPRYKRTRHNIGFDVVETFADKHFFPQAKVQFEGLVSEHLLSNEKVVLLQPQTFMNLSGKSVRQCVDFFKLDLNDILVVLDDMNLDVGKLRLRPAGSAGGQNGLANIIQHLGTDRFARLRIGIGRPPGRIPASDFVLHRFTDDERVEVDIATQNCVIGLERWLDQGLEAAMNLLNQSEPKPKKSKREKKKPSDGAEADKTTQQTPSDDSNSESPTNPSEDSC